MNILDQVRKVVHCNAIIADMRSNNIRRERKQRVFGTVIIGHRNSPLRAETSAVSGRTAKALGHEFQPRNIIELQVRKTKA